MYCQEEQGNNFFLLAQLVVFDFEPQLQSSLSAAQTPGSDALTTLHSSTTERGAVGRMASPWVKIGGAV